MDSRPKQKQYYFYWEHILENERAEWKSNMESHYDALKR